MKLRVKYFGMIAEWTGCSGNTIEFSGLTVSDLRSKLQTDHPKLESISYQVALDQKLAAEDETLQEEHEVALLPPFAGG